MSHLMSMIVCVETARKFLEANGFPYFPYDIQILHLRPLTSKVSFSCDRIPPVYR